MKQEKNAYGSDNALVSVFCFIHSKMSKKITKGYIYQKLLLYLPFLYLEYRMINAIAIKTVSSVQEVT